GGAGGWPSTSVRKSNPPSAKCALGTRRQDRRAGDTLTKPRCCGGNLQGETHMADVLRSGKVGILVGGGPAPGINGVIAAATIEAVKNGADVIGIYEGFRWLATGKLDDKHCRRLGIDDVSRIHGMGGSMLQTSRFNPTKSEKDMQN